MKQAIYRVFILAIGVLPIGGHATAQYNEDSSDTTHTAITWEPIKDSDVIWKKHVWRQIDTHDDKNRTLRGDSSIPTRNIYAYALMSGIASGAFKAYNYHDTGFTTPLSIDSVSEIRYDQVAYYRIREDWIFDRRKGQMEVRITAIAPVAVISGKQQPLFWVRYTDTRNYMTTYHTYDEAGDGRNWNEYFESRQFSSKITHVDGNDKIYDSLDDANKSHKRKKHRSEWVY